MNVALDDPATITRSRPPAWLLVATGILALTILGLSVAETSYSAHWLIDEGDYVSVIGLAFIAVAGLVLYRQQRLFASLPLVFPWLLYPVITQGDQLIDNMSINTMRVVCDVLLAAIFATPVGVAVLGVEYVRKPVPGALARRRAAALAAVLMTLEIWLAYKYLGALMVVTLVVMILAVVIYGLWPEREGSSLVGGTERFALVVLVIGVLASGAAYFLYKDAPGAYQGSPSFYMDPSRKELTYPLDRVAVPSRAPALPASPADIDAAHAALTGYARTLEQILAGYHVLDRNYTYDFHNELFLRHTPLVPNYRAVGLGMVRDARRLKADADRHAEAAKASLATDDPLRALLDDVSGYIDSNFTREQTTETMTAAFEKTKAGLQHSAHFYEGEGKYLGARLLDVVQKHQAVMNAPALLPVTQEFAATSRSIFDAYANHVVGF